MLRNLTVVIDADIARFQSAISSVSGGLNGLAQRAQSAGSVLSLALSAPLGALGAKAIDTYSEMDALRRGLATLEKDAGTLQKRLGELNEVAKMPGLGLKEAYQFDVALRSAGFSADLSKRSMLAFGNALATIGKGKNELKGLSVQLQQLAGKSGGFGADIRIIKEYAPQVGEAMRKAFGTTSTDAIAKMGLNGKQVIEKIVEQLAELPAATGSAKNTFENFGDGVTRSLSSVGEAIFKSLRVGDFLNAIGSTLERLAAKFGAMPAATQAWISALGLLAVAIPPLIAGIGFFTTTILPALRAGMLAVRTASTLMLGPIGLIAAAVAAAAVLIIMHWDKVKGALVSTGMWTQLKELVKVGLGVITSLFGVFANLFQGDWANLWEHLKNIVKYAWNGIVTLIGAGILAAGGLLAKGLSAFGLDDWSNKIKTQMDMVKETLSNIRFRVNAPAFNPFEGFQFGGQNAQDGTSATDPKGTKKKKAKSEEDPTALEVLERIRKHIEEQMQEIRAAGGDVSADLAHELVRVEDQIARIKAEAGKASGTLKTRGDNPVSGNLESEDSRVKRFFDGLQKRLQEFSAKGFAGLVSEQIEKVRQQIDTLTLNKLAIPKEATDSLYALTKQLDQVEKSRAKAALVALKTEMAALGSWNDTAQIKIQWKDVATENLVKMRDRVIMTAKDMTTAVQGVLAQGATGAAEAMGGFVAGLINGTQRITELPKIILNVFADMLQSLATALAASAAVMLFVPGLQGQAAAQFAGAAGLFAVSGLARSMAQPKKLKDGAYLDKPTYMLGGEYSGANLHGQGEWVTPVNKGASLIATELAKSGMMGGGNGGGGEFVLRASELVAFLNRTTNANLKLK